MQYLKAIFIAASAIAAVSAAPTSVNKDLLKLGQTVQLLNARFKTMSLNDPCESESFLLFSEFMPIDLFQETKVRASTAQSPSVAAKLDNG